MKTLDYERYQFQLIEQERGETFDTFLMKLRCQIPKCKFSNEDSRMRGQIINKCALNKLREQAFANFMELKQLILQATTIEEAEKESRTQPKREDSKKCCTRCGFSDHDYFSSSCPAKNKRCESCKKFGHFARLCRTPNYVRKRAGDRRNDSPDDRNKRCREEPSQDTRSLTTEDARPQPPSSSSGGTNKDETLNTNDSNANPASTSSTKNGTKSTAKATAVKSLPVPMVKIEPAAVGKAASKAEKFFACTVGGMQMNLVVRPDCPVDAVMSKENYRKLRSERHIHTGGQRIPTIKFGNVKICGIFTSSIVTCSGYASSKIFVQESGEDFLVVNETLAQHLEVKSKAENLKSP